MHKKDLIARPDYISMISPYIDVHVVKVLSGVRRCGKSCILDMIGNELLKRGIGKENIITRLYTSVEVEDGFSKTDMYEELKHIVTGDSRKYLLLDEVQEIEGWEQAVNTLFETSDVDIYVTGSNSRLTPENLSTYLSGRYVLIPVYPLSFREYL
ncbi:MAG: AAA family ATPase, partial [Spirochaetales bacterium]|nr:AAA family ATPase [Spirochaetales bacterium]